MTQGLAALLLVLMAASAFGLWRRRTDGAMRQVDGAGHAVAAQASPPPAEHPHLTAEDLGAPLGEHATLVQFSSAFCQPCRATRLVLGQVADMVPGVAHIEIDAEHHLDLVRRLHVMRTPTVFVLDEQGAIRTRAAGTPRKSDVVHGPPRRRSRRSHPVTSRRLLDPRGLRFGAGVTTVVLAAVLLSIPSTFATVLLSVQTFVFALGAFFGLGASPYGLLFRALIRPRLDPPAELEEEAAPKFAQAVGFAFAGVGLVALLLGLTTVGVIAVAMALAAAFLNAAFGFCLGCELYLLLRRRVDSASAQ